MRTPCCDKSGLKKGTWTPEEDRKLIAYISRYGSWNWRRLPKYAGKQKDGNGGVDEYSSGLVLFCSICSEFL